MSSAAPAMPAMTSGSVAGGTTCVAGIACTGPLSPVEAGWSDSLVEPLALVLGDVEEPELLPFALALVDELLDVEPLVGEGCCAVGCEGVDEGGGEVGCVGCVGVAFVGFVGVGVGVGVGTVGPVGFVGVVGAVGCVGGGTVDGVTEGGGCVGVGVGEQLVGFVGSQGTAVEGVGVLVAGVLAFTHEGSGGLGVWFTGSEGAEGTQLSTGVCASENAATPRPVMATTTKAAGNRRQAFMVARAARQHTLA